MNITFRRIGLQVHLHDRKVEMSFGNRENATRISLNFFFLAPLNSEGGLTIKLLITAVANESLFSSIFMLLQEINVLFRRMFPSCKSFCFFSKFE